MKTRILAGLLAVLGAPSALLAQGDVTAVVKEGVLVIVGDDEANSIVVTELVAPGSGVFLVTGEEGTLVNGLEFDKFSGGIVDLEIDLGRKENVLIVPNMAVKTKDDSKVVTKMINGAATEVTVEVGLSDDEHTEITSGLSEGDEIAVDMFSNTSGTGNSTGSSGQSGGQTAPDGDGGSGMMPGL